jgi:Gpi18-like mannosyltransferase
MTKGLKNLIPIILISLIPTLLIWLPFFFRIESIWNIPLPKDGMATVVANYDGPLYLAVAKTMYDKELLSQSFSFGLPSEYYAAHFPMFPLLIKLFAGILGFPYSMLMVTIVSSILATHYFHKLISLYVAKENALWVTFVFSLFPARWLIVRSVGSAEPLFLAMIIASIYYFKEKKYLWAGVFGGLAQLTKSPGILLFVAYFFAILVPNFKNFAVAALIKSKPVVIKLKSLIPQLLIPLALLSVFVFYKYRMNDFFAYFNSGDNIHLFFPPFQIFNYSTPWVGTFWLEEILFIYLFGLLGLARLIRMKEVELSWFVGIFLTSIFFVSHRDIIRYSLPIVPFLFIAFKDTLVNKEFRYIMLILAIPIYLFSLVYISQNVMPVSNWAPLL